MKVLYIHQYFRTPEEGGSLRSYYLGRNLVKKGIAVEIISGHNKPFIEVKNIEGMTVHYLPVLYDNKMLFTGRIKSFLQFAIYAIIESKKLENVSISYVMTTPLTTGFIALYNKWIRGIPYIFEIGDLWPEVPIQMGIIKSFLLKKILFNLEKLFYNQALGIVGLSEGISNYIKKKVPNQSIETIPNISDCSFYMPIEKNIDFKSQLGINEDLVISYTGTIGLANHLEYLLDAANVVQELAVIFIIVGDGSEKLKLETLINKRKLNNVKFLPATDKAGVRQILNISDAIYLSFQNIDVLHTGSPNKLFDGLAAGKMVISNLRGWTHKLIEENKIGFAYNPSDPNQFLENIKVYIADKEKLDICQVNARRLAENYFSEEILAKKQLKFIKRIISHS